MVTLSDCSHMEIKKIDNCDVVKIEKKAVCRIDVADINGYTSPKRLHIAISNLYKLMNEIKACHFSWVGVNYILF